MFLKYPFAGIQTLGSDPPVASQTIEHTVLHYANTIQVVGRVKHK